MHIAGCILAGGQSSRMGVDKAAVFLGDKPLLNHVIDRLRPQVTALVINTNSTIETQEYPVVPDQMQGFSGPLAGILACLAWAKTISPKIDAIVTVPVDTPFFPSNLVAKLQGADQRIVTAIKCNGKLHPIFALWPLSIEPVLREWLSDAQNRSVKHFLSSIAHTLVDLPCPEGFDPFMNINTPEDLLNAELQIQKP